MTVKLFVSDLDGVMTDGGSGCVREFAEIVLAGE